MPSPITINGLQVTDFNLVNQWGLSPASGSVGGVGGDGPSIGGLVGFTVGGFSFYGIALSNVEKHTFGGGLQREITLADFREKLKDDTVYGFFNRIEVIEDDPDTPGIDRRKRYLHLLPENWSTYTLTRTNEPLTAQEMLRYVLTAPTVSYTWTMDSHARLTAARPFYVDFESGKELGVVVQEIIENLGLVLGISGANRLTVAVPGSGVLPSIPDDVEEYSLGEAQNPAPTRVYVIGDRNQYQLSNITLTPSWNRNWEAWWLEAAWLEKVRGWYGPYPDTLTGQAKLASDALRVTVRQVVAKEGAEYKDSGLWGDVGRMEIPGWVYLRDIVFKAYMVPRTGTVGGTSVQNCELGDGLIQAMEYDSTNGAHTYVADEYYPDTKAFVTVKGQPLDLIDPSRAGTVDPDMLLLARNKWTSNNRFTIDTANKVIVFEDATFMPGADDKGLFVYPNKDIPDIDDTLKNLPLPNAEVEASPAQVKATLVFLAERFRYLRGNGSRADTVHQPGLFKENRDQGRGELKYADDESAEEKAKEIADLLLVDTPLLLSGGFRRRGSGGTHLSGMIRQVTMGLDFSGGLVETVRFSDESSKLEWASDRELERRRRSKELFPGQLENKREAEQLRQTSEAYRTAKQKTNPHYRDSAEIFSKPVTARDCSPVMVNRTDAEDPIQGGTVIFLDDDGRVDLEAGTRFAGVSIPSVITGKTIACATQGIVPVRVQGPVAAGANVGVASGSTKASADGSRNIGRAVAGYTGSEIILLPVQLGGGGGDPKKWVPQKLEGNQWTLSNPGRLFDGTTEITVDNDEWTLRADAKLVLTWTYEDTDLETPASVTVECLPMDTFTDYVVFDDEGYQSQMKTLHYVLWEFHAEEPESGYDQQFTLEDETKIYGVRRVESADLLVHDMWPYVTTPQDEDGKQFPDCEGIGHSTVISAIRFYPSIPTPATSA